MWQISSSIQSVFGRLVILAFNVCAWIGVASADTAVGDAGHYLEGNARIFYHNPAGQAFQVTLHRFQWWFKGAWNETNLHARVTDPAGKIVVDRSCPVSDDGFRLEVPAGAPGVYTLDLLDVNNLNFWYATASLDRSVVWTGRGEGDAVLTNWFLANPFVPRRWHFWVPQETREFSLISQNNAWLSQREDHGFTLISPRGQRRAVLWGQANPDEPLTTFGSVERRAQTARILVEPGEGGRFWSVEVRMGDSHTYSDINFCLKGVPPYVARSPEEWFDPDTGQPAPVALYDSAPFVQSDQDATAKTNLLQNWTPCPALGDPDGCELRGPARAALWNPEGRELQFRLATYLPRNPTDQPLLESEYDQAHLTIQGADGRTVLEERVALKTQHGEGPPYAHSVKTGPGVSFVTVTNAEHFWMYTYPATPAVLIGEAGRRGWHRFCLEAGTARNWFFFVPPGVREFAVRASAADAGDVIALEINAPDRTLAMLYGNRGEQTVTVPPGLDGKIWHVRVDFGSATVFDSRWPMPRFPSINLTLELQGVPPYLAPTWEQWFDPEHPRAPLRRGEHEPASRK